MPKNLYDQLYKAMYDYPPMVEDLLWFVLSRQHADFLDRLDFTTLRQLPDEIISRNLQPWMIDQAWRVNFVNSQQYVCIILEFQTRIDPNMGLRMTTYSALLLETLIDEQNCPSHKSSYPPIVPIVLYNSEREWNSARDLHQKFILIDDQLKDYMPAQRYLLVQEKRELIDPLPPERSLFAGMLAIMHNTDAARVLAAWQAVDGWLDEAEHGELRQVLADLFLGVAREKFEEFEQLKEGATMGELNNVLAESMDRWPDKWVQQGRIEGREEGRMESITMVLHSQLEQKFGTIPESKLEKIESADYEQLERWTGRVIGSTSLSQIFSD